MFNKLLEKGELKYVFTDKRKELSHSSKEDHLASYF